MVMMNRLYSRVLTAVFIFNGIAEVIAILAVKGSTVQLLCPNKHTSLGTLDWLFRNTTASVFSFYASGKNVVYYLPDELKERLTVTGDHTKGEYHLNISDIRESDQGAYKCQTGIKIYVQALTIIDGPKDITLENLTQDNKIPGIEGKNMTITCTVEGGKPAPDVILTVLGFNYTGKQFAQHTFKPQRSNDGSTVTCQAGYTEINLYTLTISADIHLEFKPIITPLVPNTLSTEETKSFDVQCQSTGSRPAASMYWLLRQTNVTSNSTFQSHHDQLRDTYTVTSNLKYRVDRRYNGQKLICGAVNIAGSIETDLTLNVKYAPDVTVHNKSFPQTQTARQIDSTIDSNPPVNTCTWQHKSKYGEHIRDFNVSSKTLTLPSVSEDKKYQDTGEYVCTAENGIMGINGQLKQTGSGYVISNAPPAITADNIDSSTQYGKFGKSTKVYVNVYSIPKYLSIHWYQANKELLPSKYVGKEEPAIVKDVFHGVEVQLDGYRVTLTISDLQEADFTNYTLHLYYSISQYVQHEVTLESASAPETPLNFTITGSKETSITLQWIPGYNGGHTQTFYIEYRISGTKAWMPKEIETSNQLDTHNRYTLSGLQDKTSYELRMYAKNSFNQSQHTEIAAIKTLEKTTSLGGVIGGVAGGLVAVIVILAIIALVLFKKRKGSSFPNKRTRSHSDSEVEEGLKDNILYDGSEPEGLKVSVLYQSSGPDSINQGPNAEYAEVTKSPKKPSKSSNDKYNVQKQNDVYAEVDKKAQQKNVKGKKQKALNNNPDGEYANSDITLGIISDGEYANAEDRSAGTKKNEQGLEYADLTFGNETAKGRQPVIHGDENRTIYSEVDHTKKAPPPPQESEYEETDIKHGKTK